MNLRSQAIRQREWRSRNALHGRLPNPGELPWIVLPSLGLRNGHAIAGAVAWLTPRHKTKSYSSDRITSIGRSIAFRIAVLALLTWLVPSPSASDDGRLDAVPAHLDLTLDAAVGLALQNNRSLLDARLARTIRAFSLEVAEDRYQPTASIGPSVRTEKDEDVFADLSLETGLRIRSGGQFTLSWSKPLAGRQDSSDTVTLGFRSRCCEAMGQASRRRPCGRPDWRNKSAFWPSARRLPAWSIPRFRPGAVWCGRSDSWKLARPPWASTGAAGDQPDAN